MTEKHLSLAKNGGRTMQSRQSVLFTAWMACLLAAAPAMAQPEPASATFGALSPRLETNERIEIRTTGGSRFTGRLRSLSGTVLTARVDGSVRQFSQDEVVEIRHRKPEPWWDGMLIGLGAGAVTGIVSVVSGCGDDSECRFYAGLVVIPLAAGGGAGVGALIDRMIHKDETVFVRNGAASKIRVDLFPLVSKDTAGVKISLGF